MSATPSSRWCVATVTSAAYHVGTQVLFSSFLRHNPWFTGTLAVIQAPHEPAPSVFRRWPTVRLHSVSDALSGRLSEAEYTALKAPHFHSLEVFRFLEFERVLYLDSDIVCRGDARALFDMDGALLCSPDQAHFWERARNRSSYATQAHTLSAPDTVFARTFNTGVMAVAPAIFGESTFTDLLGKIGTRDWDAIRTGHSVSVLLNDYFSDTWIEVSERYNFLISKGMLRYRRPRLAVSEAVFLHFIGRPKPWEAAARQTIFNDAHEHALNAWSDEAGRCGDA